MKLRPTLVSIFVLSLFGSPLLAADAANTSTAHADSAKASATESATFSMYCYWTGEATLGRVPGVLRSRIGHQGGAEVVQVDYDPAKTNVVELTKALKAQNSFYKLFVPDREARTAALGHLKKSEVKAVSATAHWIEPKHSLRTRYPQLAALELEEWQAIALNSWSYFGGNMPDVLTAEQRAQLTSSR